MADTFPNSGELYLLGVIRDWIDAAEHVRLGLFKNDLTPDDDTVIGDLTPCDFTGYTFYALQGKFSVPFIDGSNRGAMLADGHVFQPSLGNIISNDAYGWYVWENDDNVLIAVKRFGDAPRTMLTVLDFFTVTLLWTLSSAD